MICQGPECDRPAISKGLCDGHYQQMRAGHELTPLQPRARGLVRFVIRLRPETIAALTEALPEEGELGMTPQARARAYLESVTDTGEIKSPRG
jgi:hypothetical protein